MKNGLSIVIYGLCDPVTSQLRYVGQTNRKVGTRLGQHLRDAKRQTKRHCCAWIKSLLKKGLKPEIFVIELHCFKENADDAEQFWIEYFRSIGCDLTNQSIGGVSNRGWHHTQEQRDKWSDARRGAGSPRFGVPWTDEAKKNQAHSQKRRFAEKRHPRSGIKHTDETRAKIKAEIAKTARVQTEKARVSRSEAMKRRWQDPAWRNSFSARISGFGNPNFGKQILPQVREAVSAAAKKRRGYKHKPETIERMKLAARSRYANDFR